MAATYVFIPRPPGVSPPGRTLPAKRARRARLRRSRVHRHLRGPRARAGELDGGVNALAGLGLDRRVAVEAGDRVLGRRVAAVVRVALVVAGQACREALEEERAAALARRREHAPEGLVHREHVAAV